MTKQETSRLIAAVSIMLPARKRGTNWVGGGLILAGKEVPTAGLDQSYIDNYLKAGSAYYENAVPQRDEVKALQRDKDLNVSAVQKGKSEDNPLDEGIDLVATGGDPALATRLDEIAADQAEQGVAEQLDADHTLEINAETGELIEEGVEPDFDDEADAQVS